MYKVFLNEKMISFEAPGNITLNKPSLKFYQNGSSGELKNWFETFAGGTDKNAIIIHPVPEKIFGEFQSLFINVQAAGGVVLRRNELLFIFRNNKWDLPKGKIDSGESASQAALREVEEECGISEMKIKKKLSSTFHLYQSPYPESEGQWIFKETFWFEMNYSGSEKGTPQTDEGISEIRWFNRENLYEVLDNTYQNLVDIIKLYRG